jgi:hypothetical protein
MPDGAAVIKYEGERGLRGGSEAVPVQTSSTN